MKKVILSFIMLTFCGIMFSQSVNGKPLSEIDVDYIMIVGTRKILSTKLTIEIDFGQRTGLIELGKNTLIKDQNGKPIEFNSMIDALNFFSKIGFKFVDAYTLTADNQNVLHWVLKRTK